MRIFVDTSVLLAASASKTGGSALILRLGSVGRIELFTSEAVIEEAIRNTEKIHVAEAVVEQLILKSTMLVVPAPTAQEVEQYEAIVSKKDTHVIAAAILVKAKILVTLDRRLIAKIEEKVENLDAMTPGELLRRLVEK